MSTPQPDRAQVDLTATATDLVVPGSIFSMPTSPFSADVAIGDPKLFVITGENASGKSLFFRAMCELVREDGLLPITVSIRERAGTGESGVARLRQTFMFGDEAQQSTGATSVSAVTAALQNLDRDQGTVLGLDEPELGLSDAYAHALGMYIGSETKTIPRACAGVIVVTHSRALVRGLLVGYGARPTAVALNAPADLDRWLAEPEVRTVAELLALKDLGLERFRWTHDALRRS